MWINLPTTDKDFITIDTHLRREATGRVTAWGNVQIQTVSDLDLNDDDGLGLGFTLNGLLYQGTLADVDVIHNTSNIYGEYNSYNIHLKGLSVVELAHIPD